MEHQAECVIARVLVAIDFEWVTGTLGLLLVPHPRWQNRQLLTSALMEKTPIFRKIDSLMVQRQRHLTEQIAEYSNLYREGVWWS